MKELSIFVDESGHFGMKTKHSPYYIVSFVFHNQDLSINHVVATFDQHLSDIGFPNHCVHTEPIIRGEGIYESMTLEDRRKIFNSLCRFAKLCPISHKTFIFRKSENATKLDMLASMSKAISLFISKNYSLFNSFDTTKLYYDNGQSEITGIMTTVLAPQIGNLAFKNAEPKDYKLFQVADLLCTIKLTQEKYLDTGHLTRSECCIFGDYHNFKRNYLPILTSSEIS